MPRVSLFNIFNFFDLMERHQAEFVRQFSE